MRNRLDEETSPYLKQHVGEPRAMAAVGRHSTRGGSRQWQAHPAVGRLLGVPLVPRDGARELRGRRHRAAHERALRQHQGRPRGAPRPRQDLPDGASPLHRPPRRLAAHGVPHARHARADLHRHVLPEGPPLRHAGVPRGARGRRRLLPHAGRRDSPPRRGPDRRARPGRHAQRRRLRSAHAHAARSTRARGSSRASTTSTAASATRRSFHTRATSSSCSRTGTRASARRPTSTGSRWSRTR